MMRNRVTKAFKVIDTTFKSGTKQSKSQIMAFYKSIKNPKTEGAAFTKQLAMGFGIISVSLIVSFLGLR
jgi:hypothetical protein